MENPLNYFSVTCSCRQGDDVMKPVGKGLSECFVCGLKVRTLELRLPEEWFLDPPEQSNLFPFCEVCGERMRSGGGSWSQIESGYYKDMAFFCARDSSHVVGTCFVEISQVEYEEIAERGKESLIDIAIEGFLFGGKQTGGEVKGILLVNVDQDGRRTFDVTGMSEAERALAIHACECYLAAGLIRDFELSGMLISFILEELLSDAFGEVDVQSIKKTDLLE